ncbi:MAG: DNA primase [Deltaproteobacteria bacterium]|nr:DNA primase [Deltaproteobacteria bacterium]
MASIPPEKIQEVRDRVDIERVIGRTIQLRRAGSRLVGLCPFHAEKTPSFSVDPQKKLFHCFGCQAGGDVFEFVMRVESIEFPEAVRLLARELGVDLPERDESPEERRARSERDRLFRLNDLAASFFEKALWAEPRALDYLRRERKLSDETIRGWHLGYAPDAWTALSDALLEKGVPEELLVRSGLSARRREKAGVYDRIRGRIIFPIALVDGAIAGFGARRCDWLEKPEEERGPKYLNSSESPVYDKSSILFGLAKARDSIRKKKHSILVEGYLDVIALHQAGVDTAVATCGTALSGRHAGLLARLAPEVVTLYDGDTAGVQATRRAAEILLAAGVSVRVVTLPEGEDPDTYVQKLGGEALAAQIGAAPHAIDAVVEEASRRHAGGGVSGLVEIVEEVRPLLLAVKDPLKRDLFVEGSARRLGIDPRVLRRHLSSPDRESAARAYGPERRVAPPQRPVSRPEPQKAPPNIELAVVRLLIERPEDVLRALEGMNAFGAFSDLVVSSVVVAAAAALRAHQPFDAQRALEVAKASGASETTLGALRRTLIEELPGPEDPEEVLKNLLRMEKQRTLAALKRRAAQETDPDAKARLDEEVAAVLRAKASLT